MDFMDPESIKGIAGSVLIPIGASLIQLSTTGGQRTRIQGRAGWLLIVAGIVLYAVALTGLARETTRLGVRVQTQTGTIAHLLTHPPPAEDVAKVPQNVTGDVIIDTPSDGATTGMVTRVEGQVADASLAVLLVVHPLGVSAYHVQEAAKVDGSGRWHGCVAVGSAVTPSGAQYEIVAVAGPVGPLPKVGEVLPDWPRGRYSSNVVSVVRRQR